MILQSDEKIQSTFKSHHRDFPALVGSRPRLELLLEEDWPFAHEEGVFIANKNELFVISNHFFDDQNNRTVQIAKIKFGEDGTVHCETIPRRDLVMANGGVSYDDTRILVCDQGSLMSPSGIYLMQIHSPYSAELVVSDFLGRPFNAVNDVVVHGDGSIWFTDPCYGFDRGYKAKPRLPNHVYRYVSATRELRAMADGIGRPNGICFSPDERTLYITDTDQIRGSENIENARASTMYGFERNLHNLADFMLTSF
jgi:gluconolactonase